VISGNNLFSDRIESFQSGSSDEGDAIAVTAYQRGKSYYVWICIAIVLCIGVTHSYKNYRALGESEIQLQENSEDLKDCLREMEEQDKMISKLELDLQQVHRKSIPTDTARFKPVHSLPLPGVKPLESPIYDLKDVLFLPRDTPDNGVLQAFINRWQLKSNIYGHCGLVKSRAPYQKPIFPKPSCSVAIITSWFPRPCGIATHSAKLVEGLKHICPPGSSIDVIAVSFPLFVYSVFTHVFRIRCNWWIVRMAVRFEIPMKRTSYSLPSLSTLSTRKALSSM
jgi:hypothetical protein